MPTDVFGCVWARSALSGAHGSGKDGSSMGKIAVVTGGNSGIGRETALALVQKGCTVYEFSRHAGEAPGVRHVTCDVTDEAAVTAAIDSVLAREGRVDIVVNNAGYGISGAVEFTDTADAKALFDANFFGMVRVDRAVLAAMRTAGGGRIVNISSIAAPVAIPFQTYYSATKAAVNAYTCALYNEVRPFGISVCAVMPGDIRTGFTAARQKNPVGDDVYGGRIARSVAGMEKDERNGMDPAVAGRAIAKIALKRRVKPLYALGLAYKGVIALTHLLDCRALTALVGLLYAR